MLYFLTQVAILLTRRVNPLKDNLKTKANFKIIAMNNLMSLFLCCIVMMDLLKVNPGMKAYLDLITMQHCMLLYFYCAINVLVASINLQVVIVLAIVFQYCNSKTDDYCVIFL